MRFDLKPVSADPLLGKVTLDIAGQSVVSDGASFASFSPIVLPSGKGSDLVQLQTTLSSGHGLRSDGPWAWLRLLDQGLVSGAAGERYQLTFTLDGRKVIYELRASSVINPFRRDALDPFRCPTRL
jgi:type VI secretion system protein ImpL